MKRDHDLVSRAASASLLVLGGTDVTRVYEALTALALLTHCFCDPEGDVHDVMCNSEFAYDLKVIAAEIDAVWIGRPS